MAEFSKFIGKQYGQNPVQSSAYYGEASKLLQFVKRFMGVNNLNQLQMSRTLQDGTVVVAQSVFGNDKIFVHTPTPPPSGVIENVPVFPEYPQEKFVRPEPLEPGNMITVFYKYDEKVYMAVLPFQLFYSLVSNNRANSMVGSPATTYFFELDDQMAERKQFYQKKLLGKLVSQCPFVFNSIKIKTGAIADGDDYKYVLDGVASSVFFKIEDGSLANLITVVSGEGGGKPPIVTEYALYEYTESTEQYKKTRDHAPWDNNYTPLFIDTKGTMYLFQAGVGIATLNLLEEAPTLTLIDVPVITEAYEETYYVIPKATASDYAYDKYIWQTVRGGSGVGSGFTASGPDEYNDLRFDYYGDWTNVANCTISSPLSLHWRETNHAKTQYTIHHWGAIERYENGPWYSHQQNSGKWLQEIGPVDALMPGYATGLYKDGSSSMGFEWYYHLDWTGYPGVLPTQLPSTGGYETPTDTYTYNYFIATPRGIIDGGAYPLALYPWLYLDIGSNRIEGYLLDLNGTQEVYLYLDNQRIDAALANCLGVSIDNIYGIMFLSP